MEYISTRNTQNKVSAAKAIAQGISEEGGLFVPQTVPKYDLATLELFASQNYNQIAKKILGDFLGDYSSEEISHCVDNAYTTESFPNTVAPLIKVTDTIYSLELWHGPTSAFKDVALQILPHLLSCAMKKVVDGKEIVILVATSGDTGTAALAGFRDVPNTRIIVFYPDGGVSPVQFLQMATQEGENVGVYGVVGNFDDTQTMVKEIFADQDMKRLLEENNMQFSSANSINWGRLLPQIVYYFSAYADLCAAGNIKNGDPVNAAVPTGNFGNILAAYYAKKMGLPIGKLICASNTNNVLTDFINIGIYDRRRDFILTSSPSMDILISSNLERFLFEIYKNDATIAGLMKELRDTGIYAISQDALAELKSTFYGGFCTENETAEVIRRYFSTYNYLLDTHTAVAFGVYEKYQKETGDNTPTIIASTANPYKFSGSMLTALEPKTPNANSFEEIFALKEITGMEIPPNIINLGEKKKRFTEVCRQDEMATKVKNNLGIE